MRSLNLLVIGLMTLGASLPCAADEVPVAAKPAFSASESATTTARVESIDHETREVTLLLASGELYTSTVGEEVRNLGQVAVGDMVYAHYTESISIQVVAGDGSDPEAFASQDTARAPEGKMPGYAASESAVETAIVEAIDVEAGTFKLREIDGEVREYTARNRDNLRLAEVGDKVVVTVTTSVVITVDKTPTE